MVRPFSWSVIQESFEELKMAVNGQQDLNGSGNSEEVVASVLHGVKDLKIVSSYAFPREQQTAD